MLSNASSRPSHNMTTRRDTQISETIAHLAADFFARESNSQSLITVTRADLSPDGKRGIIFITVLPEKFEEPAIAFAQRQRGEFRSYVKSNSRIGRIPSIEFKIDLGEKNRQRIDELTKK